MRRQVGGLYGWIVEKGEPDSCGVRTVQREVIQALHAATVSGL
jgi:hypothetical protein